jgi:hypothetical protein
VENAGDEGGVLSGTQRGAASPDAGTDSEDELSKGTWRRNAVVCAALNCRNPIGLRGARSQDNNGHSRRGSNQPAKIDAAKELDIQIGEHGRRVEFLESFEPACAVGSADYLEPFIAEACAESLGKAVEAADHEDQAIDAGSVGNPPGIAQPILGQRRSGHEPDLSLNCYDNSLSI